MHLRAGAAVEAFRILRPALCLWRPPALPLEGQHGVVIHGIGRGGAAHLARLARFFDSLRAWAGAGGAGEEGSG